MTSVGHGLENIISFEGGPSLFNTRSVSELFDTLRSTWLISLDSFITPDQFEKIVELYERFFSLDINIKEGVSHYGDADNPEKSFMWRKHKWWKQWEDRKEYFHYNPEMFSRYSNLLWTQKVIKEMFLQSHELYQVFYQLNIYVLSRIDSSLFPIKKIERGLLRVVKYEKGDIDEHLTHLHTDRWIFTIAIGATQPWHKSYVSLMRSSRYIW